MVTFWRSWIITAIAGVGAFLGVLAPQLVADENVGIGTTRPDSSAVLDVSIEALSRPRGMLIPRMTEQERDAIIFPARGLLIFNTTRNRIEMNVGDRTAPVWARFVTYGETSGGDWALTGNAGIDPSRNFLGTVDAAPLIFKTDARERMRITSIGAVGIGTVTPLGLFAVGPNSEFYVDSSGTIYGVQLRLQGSNARLYIGGSSGIAGDILVSSGPNAPQRWTKQLDSLEITSLHSGTVSSRTVVTDTLRAQYIVGSIPFDSVKSGINQNQTLTVGDGSVLSATGTGIVEANRVNLTGTNAPLETNGSAGTSGQVLKSRGAGQTPEWTSSLDSLDIRRLTTGHVWADTVTADSVRGRVGRFDSLMVEFLRGDTAYISRLRVDSIFSTGGLLRAAVPFDSVKSGINQNQTLTVGNGSTVEASGTGIVRANRVNLTGSNAPLETNGNAGTSGQVLKSRGAGQTPEWTWRLDSLDVGRLTVDHIWADTLTADSVRARVGRFDSVVVGSLRAAIPFDSVKSGVNQNQTLTVGNGSVLEASGSGIVRANRVNLTGSNAPLETNGNAGTSGQLLKSKGAGQTPEWTWRLDSVDVGRLTVEHVWSDTLTADSVRARVGRFDSVVVATPFAWQLKGNSGTNPATNFLGTTDAQPLVLRTNGSERLRVESGGNVGIGTPSPTHRLHVNAPSDPLRLEGVQTDASPAEVLTVTATGVVKKASVASIVGGGILKGIFTPTTTASQFTISPGQDIQPGAVVVVTVYGSSSSGVVGAMVTNINAATDTFTIATTMAIDNTYAIHYIIINP